MPVTTGSFAGKPFPPEVVNQVIDLLISGSPFANSLTRYPTASSAVAWPVASPAGYTWLSELAPFPVVNLNDNAYVVGLAKIGGIVDLSNESVTDSSINLTAGISTLLRDSMAHDLDNGLLTGTGVAPQPPGVIGIAPSALGATLIAQVTAAKGAIGDAGGTPDTLAINATTLATEDTRAGTTGELVYAQGFAAAMGLNPVVVPGLSIPLVYDSTRMFLAVRDDSRVEYSTDFHFNLDATSVRIKARVVAAVPAPNKTIRKLSVTMREAEAAGTGKK